MQPPRDTSGTSPTRFMFIRKGRVSGLVWILLAIAALFVVGAVISMLRTQRDSRAVARSGAVIYFGVAEFTDASEGGVTFNDVYPPDSPADKAGLVGGDIINTFDGHVVRHKGDMLDLLRQTPVGKKVEVTYLRDGETKKTQLTTISQEHFAMLADNFETRPAGHGSFGFEDPELVPIEGSNISGVRLNDLSSNGPAALAGIQEGDIVIEFDGVPIRKRGEFITRVKRAIPYSTVKVVVVRGPQRLEIPVKIGKRG